jgi:hypothetical protein
MFGFENARIYILDRGHVGGRHDKFAEATRWWQEGKRCSANAEHISGKQFRCCTL